MHDIWSNFQKGSSTFQLISRINVEIDIWDEILVSAVWKDSGSPTLPLYLHTDILAVPRLSGTLINPQ